MASILTCNIPPEENLLPERPAPFDLLLIPQSGDCIPMPHIPDGEVENMILDWHDYGSQAGESVGYWDVAFAHRRGKATTVSSILRIPRTARKDPGV